LIQGLHLYLIDWAISLLSAHGVACLQKAVAHNPQWVAEGSWFSSRLSVPMGKNELCRTNVGDAVLAALKHNHEKCAWHCRFCLLVPDHCTPFGFPARAGYGSRD
jgi:hypothetical protein